MSDLLVPPAIRAYLPFEFREWGKFCLRAYEGVPVRSVLPPNRAIDLSGDWIPGQRVVY